MSKITIEECFGASMRHARKLFGTGFQARVMEMTGATVSQVSETINKNKGASEKRRKEFFEATIHLVPDFPAKDYESFLDLGQWITEGGSPEGWSRIPHPYIPTGIGNLNFSPEKSIASTISPRSPFKVPLISLVKAGDWHEAIDPYQPGYADHWVPVAKQYGPNAFALLVDGDSMEPEFRDGDYIVVDPSLQYGNGSYVVAKTGEAATFKKLVIDGSSIFLKPLNERYPIKDMTGVKNFRIVGVVVFKGKEY